MTRSDVHLYSMHICPFVQRTRILLRLKGVAFEHREMDPSALKEPWFQTLNPDGMVPVLAHKGRVLNESAIINGYLEEVFPERPMWPTDPYERALAQRLMQHCDTRFIQAQYGMTLAQDRSKDADLRLAAVETWRWLNDFLMRHNPSGTWAFAEFGMADIHLAPFFARYCVPRYFRHFELPAGQDFARVRRWADACVAHEEVVATGMPEDHYIKLYYDHARGYRKGVLPAGEISAFDMSVSLQDRPLPPRPSAEECGIPEPA
jgi:glutathione S-transferase